MINLSGKTALVTGSTRGIGKATAYRLSEAGAKVVVTGRSEDRAREVAKEISDSTGNEVFSVALDIGSKESIEEALKRVNEEVGGVDILVNNAGINRDTLFIRMKYEDWDEIIRVNLTGTFLITQLVVKGMLKKKWGRVINMSSVVAFIGNVGQANYSAAKAGLVGFTKTLAKELAPRNITVNAIAPGFIETDMTENLPEEIKQGFLNQIPMNRFGKSEDVANVVLFLASDLSSYITGEVIHVNGGLF
ncbi:3-oxoacyl-[acyl-carrier-protein] reductase [Hydrogenivirga sp. 128-5-R1-1]|uniref:3-oxoacyl-[acyl-carrier-protein] reductase n=1 Tax=Hydrogenivirga sp. 128-5-R1-1 TaxID=392423 RepID=UPI00015F2D5F|nr:3-oxoacyl-[acyl-carrier-protein] reductase [Hydrogenivirga sp. 128-5-R1-1]EDP74632.1 3-oxoacyl-[acyl-carrier-protein] reductase [Hydrogenivirga sp. 128-5-R1-1]